MTGTQRLVLTADEVGALTGFTGAGVRKRARTTGHFLGVAPLPDTGKRVIFPRAAIERALRGAESVAS